MTGNMDGISVGKKLCYQYFTWFVKWIIGNAVRITFFKMYEGLLDIFLCFQSQQYISVLYTGLSCLNKEKYRQLILARLGNVGTYEKRVKNKRKYFEITALLYWE